MEVTREIKLVNDGGHSKLKMRLDQQLAVTLGPPLWRYALHYLIVLAGACTAQIDRSNRTFGLCLSMKAWWPD